MIVLLDNRDSFVFNLSRYLDELGCTTHVVRSDTVSLEALIGLNPSHLIVSPGPCGPEQAGISMEAIAYFHSRIPILGVCLGHQAIAAVFQAKVIRAKTPMHGKQDFMLHNNLGLFAQLPSPLPAARYHSLEVSDEDWPSCLEVVARNAEGSIMALKHKRYPTWGVQFHPESVLTLMGHQLLSNFLQEKLVKESI